VKDLGFGGGGRRWCRFIVGEEVTGWVTRNVFELTNALRVTQPTTYFYFVGLVCTIHQ